MEADVSDTGEMAPIENFLETNKKSLKLLK